MKKPNILLLTLEFPLWHDAAKCSYEANFGIEEGLKACGVTHLTVPIMHHAPGSHWVKWLDIVRSYLRGKQFDQVWFEAMHSRFPVEFLEFISAAAPVRIGFVVESTEFHTLESAAGKQQRTEKFAANHAVATHLVVVDEADWVRFNCEGSRPAFWWAGPRILSRFLVSTLPSATQAPATFHGTLYGERAKWLNAPEIQGLLVQGTSLEDGTQYPGQWNNLSKSLVTALENKEPIEEAVFYDYINFIRTARRMTYPLWIKSLAQGVAVVNLPQFGKAYATRVSQGMAAGRPVVTWEIPGRPRTRALFENGREILLYAQDNPVELAEHIKHLRADPGFGQMLAHNAIAKIKRFYTLEKFVTDLFKWVETGAEPDYGDGVGARSTPSSAWTERSLVRPTEPACIASEVQLGSLAGGSDLDRLRSLGLWREGQPLRLHLGCGEQHFPDYINIDYPSDQHNVMEVKSDYQANITQMVFPPGSVDEIRLHHVFEHFNRVTALAMLIKWQQWLKVGGKLHIETPDLMGSAEILVSNVSWPVKMGTIRHLAGDQAASWAYHVDHWFPERYQHTMKLLGFGKVETQTNRWPHPPHLCNVHAFGTKTEVLSLDQLLKAADDLLWESTVAPVEKPTHTVWTRQLRAVLQNIPCGPGNIHVADAASEPTAPAAAPAPVALPAKAVAQPVLPAPAAGLMPLAEIHDFNQLARDRWVKEKASTVPAGLRVLDMGAGTCLYRPLFAHCEYKTHDFKQYEGAEKHGGTSAYGKIDYVSEILTIPAPDHSFDIILCTEVLEHVPEPIKVLREISRLLKPGGRAFITAPLGSGLHQLPFHFYGGYTPEWYKRFSHEAGLDAIEITPNGGFFKHLAQECARAGSLYAQKPALHGPEAGELHRLLVENLPRLFFGLDEKCFDARFTVGYFVEVKKPVGKSPPKGREDNLAIFRSDAPPPVVVKLMGGVGNQMFQYAAGRALAAKHNAPLKLDLTFLQDRTPRANFTQRDYALDIFPLQAGCELITEVKALPAGLKHVSEKHFAYDSSVPALPPGVMLEGYWQSPRYFSGLAETLKEDFSLAPVLPPEAKSLAEQILAGPAVCLHVRRGDMAHNPHTASVHGTCTTEYYQAACEVMARKHPAAKFFVFSDDPAWCKTQDLTRGRLHVLVGSEGGGSGTMVDLYLMRLCRHFIIANSTFSWWAAYLSDSPDKTVIAPEPWFSDPSMDTSDLLPQSWMRLSRCPGPVMTDRTKPPLVSVVMPCYKQAHFLAVAIESVVAQTFSDWELIVVNDGSPDDTGDVTREIIACHPERRIRLLEKPNGGLADARNAGIGAALGKYILPLDADDKLHPEMLRQTVDLLNANPNVAIAYTDLAQFGVANKVLHAAEYDFSRLPLQNQLNCCSLFRREAWTAAGGYNPNMKLGYEDWDFWVGCGEKGFFGQRIAEPLFYYRVKDSSMYTKAVEHHRELHAQIVLNHPALYDEATRREAAALLAAAQGSKAECALRQAESLARRGELEAAVAQVSLALELEPTAECAGRAEAVMRLIATLQPAADKKTGFPAKPASEDFFGPEECPHILQLIAAYADDPAKPEVRAQACALRQSLAEFLDRAESGQLESLFRGDFGQVYRAMLRSGVQREPVASGATAAVETPAAVTDGAQALALPRLLSLMLFTPSQPMRLPDAAGKIPAWFVDDYLGYVLQAAAVRTEPLVSVIVPCYKQAGYLREAVGSVVAQTFPNWELIIVNDGSPDETSRVAREIIASHPQRSIRLIEKKNGGLADARNAGIREARGRYFLPLDADDMIHPRMLARTAALLECHPEVGIAYSDWKYFGAENHTREAIDYDFKVLTDRENLFTCTALFRKEAWQAAGGYNLNMTHGLEDWDFWIGCGEHGFIGQRIPEVLFFYRAKAGSMIHTVRPHLHVMYARIVLNHPRLYKAETVAEAKKLLAACAPASVLQHDSETEPLPPNEGPGEFQQLVRKVETLVQGHNFREAIVQAELALKLAPNAECQTRAEEIIALIRDQAEGPVPAAVEGNGPSGNDFFGPAELTAIDQLIAAYTADPANAEALAGIGSLRQGLADFLAGAEARNLETLFSGDFGQVYRKVLNCGLLSEAATNEQLAAVKTMAAGLGLAGDGSGDLVFARLLALMLFAPAHQTAVPLALEKIPAWFLDDYLGYVLYAPPVFALAGEAETYREHMLAWVRSIQHRVRTAPAEPLTLHVAHHFALKANYIPLYFTAANTRELAEKRAAIMEFVVAQRGGVLNASFPKRSREGRKISVGYLNAHFSTQTETHVTLPCLHLDRSKFELILFPLTLTGGPLEDYCRSLADKFVHLPPDLGQQVSVIRQAELDVIIIGTNVTAVTNQVALLALHRLAPLQLVSYCSPVSTGMRHVDGYLSGTFAAGEGVGEHFSEKLCLCEGPPGCLDYTVENRVPAKRFDRASMGIAESDVIFVNAAACFKILPEMQETWAKIIRAVDHSRLLLLPFNPNWNNTFPVKQFTRTLGAAFRRQGLGEDRIMLAGSLPSRAEVKELENIADVYLDTYPFSGSISVIDPLELGIPSVVWEGKTHRSRMAAALLRELAIPELIAHDEKSYVDISVNLATDASFRRLLKARILDSMDRKPRFINPAAYGKQLGDLLVRLVTGRTEPAADSGRKRPKAPASAALVA